MPVARTALSEAAAAERRIALVVGNSKYRNTIQLSNPANDAKDMAATLRDLGFDVIEMTDIDKRGWDLALGAVFVLGSGTGRRVPARNSRKGHSRPQA